MDDVIDFYTNPRSRGSMVHWMLEEVGAPYRRHVMEFGPALKSPEYLAINPMGKVPAIRYRGQILTETAAICAWLADAYPQAGMQGTDRAAYYRWLFFGAGPLDMAMIHRRIGFDVTDATRVTMSYTSFDHVIAMLEQAVQAGPFLAGDRFSTADLYVGSAINYGLMLGTVPPNPALSAYWDRMKDRPARLRALGQSA